MSDIDKYFDTTKNEFQHPRIAEWGSLVKNDAISLKCEIYRKRDGLRLSSPKIYLRRTTKNTGITTVDSEEWDEVLNLWLIDNNVQAVNQENEGLRFYLRLRRMLQRAEHRYGDGYFNAVLIEVVNRDFSSDDRIMEMLKVVSTMKAGQGISYAPAIEMIESAIKDCAAYLIKLGYSLEIAKSILTNSLALYIDERFSVTNRKLLGLV